MNWWTLSPLEITAALLSLGSVWLSVRRSLVAWPVTILASLLYGEFFREIHLYSDMMLQVIFAICGVYGWWHWLRGVRAEGEVTVLQLSARGWAIGILAGLAGTVALGAFMVRYTDATLPWLDAALTAFSLVGTFWEAQKYIANWTLWIAVDLVYIFEYAWKQAWVTAILSAIFVVLAVLGLRDWRRALAAQTTHLPEVSPA